MHAVYQSSLPCIGGLTTEMTWKKYHEVWVAIKSVGTENMK